MEARAVAPAPLHPLVKLSGAVAAVSLAALCGWIVDGNQTAPGEVGLFRLINGLPAFLYPLAWPAMQLGNLFASPAAAIVAAGFRKWSLAVGLLAIAPLKLVASRIVKDHFDRQRPASVIDEVTRRGDASAAGQAFLSGHAVIAVGLATVAHPYLGRRGRILAWAGAAVVCIGRIYVGAHLPLDTIAGAALGYALGTGVLLVLGSFGLRSRGRRADK